LAENQLEKSGISGTQRDDEAQAVSSSVDSAAQRPAFHPESKEVMAFEA
jgi:hypothetical protein